MTPIKMKDGQLAYPIASVADLREAQKLGCAFEFTACGCAYDLPSCDKADSGGWIRTGMAEHHATTGGRVRGIPVRGIPVRGKTLWQRIKGWFA